MSKKEETHVKTWQVIVGVVILAVLGVGGYFGYTQYLAPVPPTPTPPPITNTRSASRATIVSAEAVVVPVREARLSFEVSGRVAEVLVDEGDRVEAGQVVARLEQTDWQQRVAEAEAALEVARSRLAQVQAGARAEEIEAARQDVAAAEAQLGVAQAGVAVAQATLANVEAGPKPEDITAAKVAMEKAAQAVRLAQGEYDKVSYMSGQGSLAPSVALEQATQDYEMAKATYEALVRGATEEEKNIARAGVLQARAQLPVLKAQLGQARARLALLEAGPSAEAIAVAQAQVRQAETALEGARIALAKTELLAPFAGTIGQVMTEVGETVSPGVPLIRLGDLGDLRLETDDLSEVDIALVRVGQKVEVSIDALPDAEFRGTVVEVRPVAEVKHGDTTYTVTIDVDEGVESGLRWGMTAYVDIQVEE